MSALLGMLSLAAPQAFAGGCPHKSCSTQTSADTTPPSVALSSPAPGATVSGTVAVAGTASDNVKVANVQVSVDGGTWQTASGTTSWNWSWSTTGLANGTHTVAARATDTSGNVSTAASESVTVGNPTPDTTPPAVVIASPASGSTVSATATVSGSSSDNVAVASVQVSVDGGSWQAVTGTTSWTWSWNTGALANGSHTLSARSTDTSGNVSQTASESVNVSNTTSTNSSSGTSSGTAPATQGTWTSPEGATIVVNSVGINPATGKTWTIADIYGILKAQTTANSTTQSTFLSLAPHYEVYVQDQYSSMTSTSYTISGSSYSNFSAITYLQGVNSTFSNWPDYVLCHEYGIAWTQYFWAMYHQADWSSYLNMRLDGSTYNGVTYQYLGQDPRLWSSLTWDAREIIGDDYRLLFGSSAAISERSFSVNGAIVDPRNQTGLGSWLLQQWA